METLTFIYYATFAIVGLLVEFTNFIKPGEILSLVEKTKQKQELTEDERRTYMFRGCNGLFYIPLTIIGLFTSQWIFFVALIVLAQIMLLFKIQERKLYSLLKIDAFISIIIIMLIVLNKYHNIIF